MNTSKIKKFKKGDSVNLTDIGKNQLDKKASLGKINRLEFDEEDQEWFYYVSWDKSKKETLHYYDEITLAFPDRF